MRIVTRPDFDGIVCAVIIIEAHSDKKNAHNRNFDKKNIDIIWLEPSEIQNGSAEIKQGDIMANLPFDKRCSVWFDHHVSNKDAFEKYVLKTEYNQSLSTQAAQTQITESKKENKIDIQGDFKIAPSAAGVVYQYYKNKGLINKNFDELIKETDIIDAALLSMDQVIYPEKYPFILLSMTVKNRDESDPPYWNRLVELLRYKTVDQILSDSEVKTRCAKVICDNREYSNILKEYTHIQGNISITDFRSFDKAPSGNRFLVYSLFPECTASIKIRYDDKDKSKVLISIGKSIFNDGFNINIGKLLAKYGGGGHAGAGGCTMNSEDAQKNIDEMLKIMTRL